MNTSEKTIIENNLKILEKLQRWLARNPANSPLVKAEADAVLWAIKQFEDALEMAKTEIQVAYKVKKRRL